MFPELVYALTDKDFEMRDSILHNHKRCSIYDGQIRRKYSAMIEEKNSVVNGKIIFDVDKKSLAIIDFLRVMNMKKRK